MGDENSTAAITTTGGPRLANKASNNALSTAGGVRLGKAAIGVAAVLGKAGSTTSITGGVGAGPRRALLDTTNAIRVSQDLCSRRALMDTYYVYHDRIQPVG